MPCVPRLAVATPGDGPDPSPAGLALLAALTHSNVCTQHFRARACPTGSRLVGELTGLPGRHLDSWLMPSCVCRAVFDRGSRRAELSVVEGTLDEPAAGPRGVGRECFYHHPGPLRPLAEALNAPIVAVVPCSGLEGMHLPRLPEGVDAVILDGLERRSEFPHLKRMIELLSRKPVLGALEALPDVRAAIASTHGELSPEPGMIGRLTQSFLRFADLDGLRELSRSRPSPTSPIPLDLRPGRRRFRVAYAHDEAFGGYFPDTLEMLETLGADLVQFSPLADENLPDKADLVMIGCGFPDDFAERLAMNFSLTAQLRSYVCRGGRLYAESGGAAYLARQMVLDGECVPGAGVLPVDAVRLAEPETPYPVERTLIRNGWLGPAGSVVRGYHCGRWAFRPAPEPGDCPAKSGSLTACRDVNFRRNAVGSLIHLHLASLPEVVEAFVRPMRSEVQGG